MKLEIYEVKCPSCNGGKRQTPKISGIATWWICSFCSGSGKIDWIDKLKFETELNKNREMWRNFKKKYG